MHSRILLPLACAVVLFFSTYDVFASSLAGKPCLQSELGVTKFDDNKTGVVGCFYMEEGSTTTIWKAGFPIIPEKKQLRHVFTESQKWTVPEGVTSVGITMAGGGGSGMGWRYTSAYKTGHSGGYVFSHPVTVTPGQVLTIIVGKGGEAYPTVKTNTPAKPGPPYFIHIPPAGDDGLGGYPGTSSKVIDSSGKVLLECAGGSGGSVAGYDTYDGGLLTVGPQKGATFTSGVPKLPAPKRDADGTFAISGGPGACGPKKYGIGNYGDHSFSPDSGTYQGATTPFGYGSGGAIQITGCYVTEEDVGKCFNPRKGRDGVVFIDLIY